MVGFSDRTYPGCTKLISLWPSVDSHTIAFCLYDALRSLDREGIKSAGVDFAFSKEGEFTAIAERLLKAASPDIS